MVIWIPFLVISVVWCIYSFRVAKRFTQKRAIELTRVIKIINACTHDDVVDVRLELTNELVAKLCSECYEKLPGDYMPGYVEPPLDCHAELAGIFNGTTSYWRYQDELLTNQEFQDFLDEWHRAVAQACEERDIARERALIRAETERRLEEITDSWKK